MVTKLVILRFHLTNGSLMHPVEADLLSSKSVEEITGHPVRAPYRAYAVC